MQTKKKETAPVAPGLGWWPPFMGWHADMSANLHETFLAISNEWQAFVGRRVAEDLRTLQQFSAAKSPEQVWMVSARFWQKAVEDYTHEQAVMTKLASNFLAGNIALAEEAQDNAEASAPLPKAA